MSHKTGPFNRKIKAIILCCILSTFCRPAYSSTGQNPTDSIVLVISNFPVGKHTGNGFAIGDGTLVVTAHHLIFEDSEQGEHQMPGMTRIFSPYLGDEFEGEIIADDEELDLVILKTPLPGHPALKLADDNSISSTERIEIIGMPEIIYKFISEINEPFDKKLNFQYDNLPVDFIAVRQQTQRFISLSGIGKLGHGCSGSPMLLPGTNNAAGCFVRIHGNNEQDTISAEGPAISQVKRFVEQAGHGKSLQSAKQVLSKPKDATDVFLLTLEAYRHYIKHENNLALEKAEYLIKMRPESGFTYSLAASILEALNRPEEAEKYYQKAIELNPEEISTKIYYAQFLSERQPDKAMEILELIWQIDNYKSFSAMLMNNILTERGEFQKCGEVMKETIKVDPNNAYLWMSLGGCQFNTGNRNEAITSMAKAVALMPEKGPYRGQLARIMEKLGRLDEAETHFRKLIEIEPDNPVVHFWLAQFLTNHRPENLAEALKEAQIALDLPAKGRISKEPIEELINKLQSQTGPEQPN